jgi:hypothetical protein
VLELRGPGLAKRYETLVTRSRRVELAGIDRDVLRGAANLRARFARRIPATAGLRIVRLDDVA